MIQLCNKVLSPDGIFSVLEVSCRQLTSYLTNVSLNVDPFIEVSLYAFVQLSNCVDLTSELSASNCYSYN